MSGAASAIDAGAGRPVFECISCTTVCMNFRRKPRLHAATDSRASGATTGVTVARLRRGGAAVKRNVAALVRELPPLELRRADNGAASPDGVDRPEIHWISPKSTPDRPKLTPDGRHIARKSTRESFAKRQACLF